MNMDLISVKEFDFLRTQVRHLNDEQLSAIIDIAKQEQNVRKSGSPLGQTRKGVMKPEARDRIQAEAQKIEGQELNLEHLNDL